MSVFQLTTSRGGRRPGNRQRAPHTYFNSQPHEEVDQNHCNRKMECNISTHDLTRRSTGFLTQISKNVLNFNSRPHEEVDGRYGSQKQEPIHFNSRPHEEVDAGSPPSCHRTSLFQLTTSRGGRHSDVITPIKIVIVFQLTTSQGGRLCGVVWSHNIIVFNSRPRKEVDRAILEFARKLSISTHDLARRSTIYQDVEPIIKSISTHDLARRSTVLHCQQEILWYFNSRPRKEVDFILS